MSVEVLVLVPIQSTVGIVLNIVGDHISSCWPVSLTASVASCSGRADGELMDLVVYKVVMERRKRIVLFILF